jgi:hypothetical protein
LFEEEIAKIIADNDYATIPTSVQALHGLYLLGKGYGLEPIRKEVADMVASLEPLVKQAVSANDSFEVLKVSRKVYRALRRLEREHKEKREGQDILRGTNLPDMVMDSLGAHKLPPDYDRMDDYPFLKDENVEERETETVPGNQPLPKYNELINRHMRHQSYLIQHLKSIIETKRRRSKKKSIQP